MAAEPPEDGAAPPLHERKILILYGTETGNSQDFAVDLENVTERLHFSTDVMQMDHVGLKHLIDYPLVIFIISTTGQGELPKNAQVFWKRLRSKKLSPTVFENVKFTTFGLGDSSYSKFNWAARKLHKRLCQLGASEFYPRGEADERHEDGIDGAFLPWSISLRSHLLSRYPLSEGESPIPPEIQLPPKVILERDSIMEEMGEVLGASGSPVLDTKAAQFSHVENAYARREELELKNERIHPNSPVAFARLSERTAAQTVGGFHNLDKPNILKDHPAKYLLEDSRAPDNLPPSDLLPIPDGWTATIASNRRITPENHWQDVRQLVLRVHARDLDRKLPLRRSSRAAKPIPKQHNSLPRSSEPPTTTSNIHADRSIQEQDKPLPNMANRKSREEPSMTDSLMNDMSFWYDAGDAIKLYPKNFPEDVQTLIDLMGWNDVADESFTHYSKRHDGIAIQHAPRDCYPLEGSTLRQLLTNNYDITAIPKRGFFDHIKFFTKDKMHFERLSEFSDFRFSDEFYDYTSRPRRSILEILQDFPSVKVPYQFVGVVFPLIRAREYSVASAGVLMEDEDHPLDMRVELLIAVVKYKTVLRKTRRGLCSRYIESLQPQTKIRISLEKHSAPNVDLDTLRRPILAIGAGTGVAPLRAFLWERDVDVMHGDQILFFGGRNKHADFFFEDEWRALKVQVFTAFSRDQKEKIYVQDVIAREWKTICDLVTRNAIICICGSAGKMPVAVRNAIYDAMIKGGVAADQQDAIKFIEKYCMLWEEVW